jgi:hypothetical protein
MPRNSHKSVRKGDKSMDLPRIGSHTRVSVTIMIVLALIIPATLWAQDYKEFVSDEYGFSMKYPGTWVKIDKPKGNYYVVFHSPDLIENFRPRIHVAAHKPVKDPISAFLQEFRNGIKDLQKQPSQERAEEQSRKNKKCASLMRASSSARFRAHITFSYKHWKINSKFGWI